MQVHYFRTETARDYQGYDALTFEQRELRQV
jgi:hypothetical protein